MEISRLNLIRIFIQTVCGSNFFSEVLLKFVSITNKKYYYNNKYKLITEKWRFSRTFKSSSVSNEVFTHKRVQAFTEN